MSLIHRFTTFTLAILLAAGALACGGTPSELDDAPEAERHAGSALIDKKKALLEAIRVTIQTHPNVRAKFALPALPALPPLAEVPPVLALPWSLLELLQCRARNKTGNARTVRRFIFERSPEARRAVCASAPEIGSSEERC